MPLFNKKLKLKHLLNGEISLETKAPLSKRIKFAWETYTGKNEAPYKTAAFNFLIQSFAIVETTKERQVQQLQALMVLKQKSPKKNFVPTLNDLFKLSKLTAIQAAPKPANPPPPKKTAVKAPPPKTTNKNSADEEFNDDPGTNVIRDKAYGKLPDADQADQEEHEYTRFAREVNLDFNTLNMLIDDYNLNHNKKKKAQLLFAIYQQQKHMNNQYPANVINAHKLYREQIHIGLFKAMQEQFSLLGFPSLNETFLRRNITTATPYPVPDPSSLAEILSNMSPEKANKMLEFLSRDDVKALDTLFAPHEPGYKEYQAFSSTHIITCLGGLNSKNFTITPIVGEKKLILRIDNRLDAPKDAEALLRSHSLSGVLSPIYAERTVTHGQDTRILLVTEYCTGGNLLEHSKKVAPKEGIIPSALQVYIQMAIILKSINSDHCTFLDMKNSNWLISDKGILQIADTKSFAFTDKKGQLNFFSEANRWYTNLTTPFMNPPEMDHLEALCSADKIHSYMLGKNLYQYLSNCSCDYLGENKLGVNYDFSNPLFSTPEGKEFQALIIATVKADPDERISIEQALEQLKKIEARINTNEMLQTLKKLDEPTFRDFVSKTEKIINTASKESLLSLQKEIKSKITEAKELPSIRKATHKLLQQLDDQSTFRQTKEPLINTASKAQLLSLQNGVKALKVMYLEAAKILEHIKKESIGKKDTETTKYINEKKKAMDEVKDQEGINTLLSELNGTFKSLQRETKVIKGIVASLRKRIGWGCADKANKIEDALCEVPLSERGLIQQGNTPKTDKLLKALAQHRHWHKKDIYLTKEDKVDEAKAPNSFKIFKQAMEPLKVEEATPKTSKPPGTPKP